MIKKKISTNTLFTFLGMIVFQLANFLLGVVISRFSGVSNLGAYQLFIVTNTFFGFFAKSGIDEKLTYTLPYLGGLKKSKSKILVYKSLSKVLLLSLISSLGVVIFYQILSIYSEVDINIYDSFFSIIYLPAFSLSILIAALFRSENHINRRTKLTYILPAISSLIFLFLFIYTELLNIYTILLMRTLAYVLVVIFGSVWLNSIFQLNIIGLFKFFSLKKIFIKTKVINKWLVVVLITFLLETGTIGIWIMRTIGDDYKVGVISILIRLSCLVYLAPTSISIVFSSLIAKKNAENIGYKALKVRMLFSSLISVIIIAVIIYLYSNQILELFGKSLGGYSEELLFMLIGASFIALTQPLQSMTLAINNLNRVYYISLIGGVVSSIIFFLSFSFNETIPEIVKIISFSMILFGCFRFLYLIPSSKFKRN